MKVLPVTVFPKIKRVLCCVALPWLVGCGGGGASTASVQPPAVGADSSSTPQATAPGMSATLLPDNKVSVTLTPATGSTATAFCVRNDSATPAATDACFTTEKTQTVNTSGSTTLSTDLTAWVRDAQNVVTRFQSLSVAGKSCSTAAYAESTKALNAITPITNSTVCVITDKGEMIFAFDKATAPITVKNFLRYVNAGFYNGTAFHRISSTFVAQGGGFVWNSVSSTYSKKTALYDAIALEPPSSTGLSNTVDTLAMARSTDLNSATSEFFVNLASNTSLNTNSGGYAVFGRVIYKGSPDTLEALKAVTVQASSLISGETSQPTAPVFLQWAYQLK